MKEDEDVSLPFLDTLVIRKDNALEFEVFRKTCSTERYTTSDSFHDMKHKMAAFHSMTHRMVTYSLTDTAFEKERQKIVRIEEVNGQCKLNKYMNVLGRC